MVKMFIYYLVVLAQQFYFLEYNSIKYVEVLKKLIKITKKFRVLIVIGSHHLQTEEKQLVVYCQQYMFHSSYQPKFYIVFHKYLFNIFNNHSYFTAQILNCFFAKHLSLTEFDLYDSHLDDSGLESNFDHKIYFGQMKKLFPAFPLFFSELNKGRPDLI